MSTFTPRALAAIATATVAAATAPAARADGFACSAGTVSGTVLGQAVEPVRAGSPDGCETASRAAAGLPASARTGMAGDRATAASSVSGLQLGSLTGLAGALPQVALPEGIAALPVPLPAAAQLLGLPSLLTVDATEAARALVLERSLPSVPLLGADVVELGATAACTAGQAVTDTLAVVRNLTALGRELPTDRPVDTAMPLAAAQVVDFSALDVTAIALPGGLSLDDPVIGPILRPALESVVSGLPTVGVPAELARVVVEPAAKDGPRQVGPRVRISALGRELADLTLGDVLASALCSPPPVAAPAAAPEPEVSPATELALSCARSDVVLTDVVEKDGKVKLVGVAAGRFVGRTISLVLTDTGRTVATAMVQPDGYFRARAPLPSKRIRWTNRARYQAVIDGERSLALKLHRRMRISRMKPAAETITITGRVYGTLGDDEIVISRREACTRDVEVTTVKPRRDGSWRITLPLPEGVDAATYRATTRVRRGDNPKRFRTFSLPGHVAL